MKTKLTQLQFLVLEGMVKRYGETGEGMKPEDWKKIKVCTRQVLRLGRFVRKEECCDCMEPTEKGVEYVKDMWKKLK